MKRLRVIRRPDGVIELRRRRLRDSAVLKEAALVAGLCAACVAFVAGIAALLVETPAVLAATGALLLPVVAAFLLARGAEMAPAPARSAPRTPPPDAA